MHAESEPAARSYLAAFRRMPRAVWLYPLAALLLLDALSLVALPPLDEGDGPWLQVGIVMAAIGLASWLSIGSLLPAVVLLGLSPLLTREALGESTSIGWNEAARLAGLLFLAGGSSIVYRSPTRRAAPAAGPELIDDSSLTAGTLAEVHTEAEDRQADRLVPALPAGQISSTDAMGFQGKLARLNAELTRTGDLVRLVRRELGA